MFLYALNPKIYFSDVKSNNRRKPVLEENRWRERKNIDAVIMRDNFQILPFSYATCSSLEESFTSRKIV